MDCNIENNSVSYDLTICDDELQKIALIIGKVGKMDHSVPYLTRYSIIKTCGAIEHGFKTLISDYALDAQSEQLKNFVEKKFRNSSMNPSYTNICDGLKSFDKKWCQTFKNKVNSLPEKEKILDSLESLNNARNSFAHGGIPSTSFDDVRVYFYDSLKILKLLEESITEE
ncbi:HEPN domain-containing protein [Candidatus Nitrotoga fabula]|uniref:RiboL-PSP-HEPN domain-containing protein n=1 Tax=Candidatus Nitrotoga fabula TaxID=2182327 RepID=A0A916BCX7_9PROT|nr:HEPN domain-containing protein [Candidatus Nitrotoga fabula]CAE6710137.1 hypothetical protein NTGZN8_190047 [Candidatus Nitrotoga fabula]